MSHRRITRRDFLKTSLALTGGLIGLSFYHTSAHMNDKFSAMTAIKDMVPLTWDAEPVDPASRAEALLARLLNRFLVPGKDRFYEYLDRQPGDPAYATLWPYTGLVAALNALAAIPDKKEVYEEALRQGLSGFEAYYDPQAKPSGYDSYLRAEGGARKYYDDNEWVGLEYIRAYELFGDPSYLDKAAEAFRFATSGWSRRQGGIYWRQGDDTTRNTCSNAPAAVLALLLYHQTGEAIYLDWAQRIMEWLKPLKSTDSGVYWDNISRSGIIDRRIYTYNTGTIIHANVLLYKETDQTKYLQEAHSLANASCSVFATPRQPDGPRLFPNTPWFNAVLMRGLTALAAADQIRGNEHIQVIHQYLDHAWQNARGSDGLFSPEPSGNPGRDDPHRWLLDQAGMVELYALLARSGMTSVNRFSNNLPT